MARPLGSLWLRLFGPNGPTTFAELRTAILGTDFSPANDGSMVARIRAFVSSHVNLPDRPGATADDTATPPARTLLSDLRITLQPGDGTGDQSRFSVPGLDILVVPTVAADPESTVAPGGERTATLFVAADPAIAAGLIPIEYGPANLREPLNEGWLATWLALNVSPMEINWDADSLGSAAIDLGILLRGTVLSSVVFSGDFSAGYTLGPQSMALDQLTLAAGSDYNFVADADSVGAGQTLVIDGRAVGAGNHVIFDGSAATAGSFAFFGGAGTDQFFGAGGDDLVQGLGGADTLTGGGGSDTFAYLSASDSTGTGYDTLADFNPAEDKIDLPGTVTGFDTAIQSGALSTGSFNADLGAALSHLGAGHAVVYAPNTGDLAGKIFLVVDGNGVAGYQAGEDYVFALPATALADLSAHPDFFI